MVRTIAKDHDKKRLSILKTAARVFADTGFARASMSQVAGACGISKANIYHYYSSKDALLFDILDTYLRELRDVLCEPANTTVTPAGQLRDFARAALLAYDGMNAEHRIQTEGMPLLAPEKQKILRSYQREMVRTLSDILLRVAPDVFEADPGKLRSATMSVFGMLNWFYMWHPKAGKTAREDYAVLVADIATNGVRGA